MLSNEYNKRLKKNFTLIIFSLFHLNWPRIGFYGSWTNAPRKIAPNPNTNPNPNPNPNWGQ